MFPFGKWRGRTCEKFGRAGIPTINRTSILQTLLKSNLSKVSRYCFDGAGRVWFVTGWFNCPFSFDVDSWRTFNFEWFTLHTIHRKDSERFTIAMDALGLNQTYHLRFLLSWRRSGHCWLPWLYKWSLVKHGHIKGVSSQQSDVWTGQYPSKVFPFFQWQRHDMDISHVFWPASRFEQCPFCILILGTVCIYFWCSWSSLSKAVKTDPETSPRKTPNLGHFRGFPRHSETHAHVIIFSIFNCFHTKKTSSIQSVTLILACVLDCRFPINSDY